MSATVSPSDATERTADEREQDSASTDAEGASKTERLHAYLSQKVSREGECYVKGKFIADEVGLTPKQIGQLMVRLQDSAGEVEIEKWSYTGATTWRVAPSA